MKYLSLFSGIGGFELGIQQAYEDYNRQETDNKRGSSEILSKGMPNSECDNVERPLPSCIGYSEIDKYACQVYNKQFNHKNYGDITKIKSEELPDFDLIVGGFPCQSFSIAGKRGGFNDTRGTLFFEIARIIRDRHPRLLVLENVKGLLSHDKGKTFTTIISTLDELGYDCQWQVLNSKNFGVPQNRERVFIIGHLRGTSRPEVFPIGGGNSKTLIVEKVVGKVKIRKHLVNINELQTELRNHKLPHTLQEISDELKVKKTKVEHWFRTDGCFAIPDEDIWFKLKKFLGIETDEFDKAITEFEIRDNKFDQSNRVYKKEGLSPTLTTLTGGHQHSAIDDGLTIRRLTPKECERLQGFPDDWTKEGTILGTPHFDKWIPEHDVEISDTQRYKMCGNAVTVNVIKEIIKKLLAK